MNRRPTQEEYQQMRAIVDTEARLRHRRFVQLVFAGGALLALACVGSCWAYPQYQVYEQRLEGEAELAKADYSKRVAVQEAAAKKDSASLLAEAEVERARGVAQANQIIGDSLRGNEAYLRYLWIHSLEEGKSEVIYVPTEANLPILEATRRSEAAPSTGAK